MMPSADDQMVVHGHAERGGGFDDLLSHRDIRLRRCRVARGMVVHQDQSGRAEFERTFDHLAGINRRMVDCGGSGFLDSGIS